MLLDLLKEKTGLNFEYYRKNFIEKRIKSRMIRVNCWTLKDYYKYLFADEEEVRKFLKGFTINYTFFFRDYDVFETFQDMFLDGLNVNKGEIQSHIRPSPAKIAKFRSKQNQAKLQMKLAKESSKPEKSYVDIFIFLDRLAFYRKLKKPRNEANTIKIWSCPCATGEEPYSIAMILNNLEQQIPNFPRYKIVASDIAIEAIEKANKGIYSDDSMKEISDYYERKYFIKKKVNFGHVNRISEDIKKKVEFIQEDVTKGHAYHNQKYDIIFCRYLFIYFNQENRHKFLKIIDKHLKENGLLILGKTETLFGSYGSFTQIDSRNHIYIKSRSKLF
ncbi:MAG: CheR family methyltransferase [Promethearchaeota archaeon]